MNRSRSSFEKKPPLAVSPRRLRPRRGRRAEVPAARTPPAPSPKEATPLRRSFCVSGESPLQAKYEKISRELKALAEEVQEDDFAHGDALKAIAFSSHAARGNATALFERGRLYEVYSARRNERLKRKMEETLEEGEAPARHSAADVEAGKRRSTRRLDSLRKSAPENVEVAVRAPGLRSSLRSSTRESSKMSSVLRSAVKYNAEADKLPFGESARKK